MIHCFRLHQSFHRWPLVVVCVPVCSVWVGVSLFSGLSCKGLLPLIFSAVARCFSQALTLYLLTCSSFAGSGRPVPDVQRATCSQANRGGEGARGGAPYQPSDHATPRAHQHYCCCHSPSCRLHSSTFPGVQCANVQSTFQTVKHSPLFFSRAAQSPPSMPWPTMSSVFQPLAACTERAMFPLQTTPPTPQLWLPCRRMQRLQLQRMEDTPPTPCHKPSRQPPSSYLSTTSTRRIDHACSEAQRAAACLLSYRTQASLERAKHPKAPRNFTRGVT